MTVWSAVVSVGLLAAGAVIVLEIDRRIMWAIARTTQPRLSSTEGGGR